MLVGVASSLWTVGGGLGAQRRLHVIGSWVIRGVLSRVNFLTHFLLVLKNMGVLCQGGAATA